MINRSNLLASISWPVHILKYHSIIIIIIVFFFFYSSHCQVLREATSFLGSGCAYYADLLEFLDIDVSRDFFSRLFPGPI